VFSHGNRGSPETVQWYVERAVRTWRWIAALLVYVFIVSIARAHHPFGVIALLMH